MIWCNANFQCIFHLNHLVNSNFIWTCNKFCCIIHHIEYSSYREKLEYEYDTNYTSTADLYSKFWMRPPGVQILSIPCSFWEDLAKSYVGVPTSGKSWIRHCTLTQESKNRFEKLEWRLLLKEAYLACMVFGSKEEKFTNLLHFGAFLHKLKSQDAPAPKESWGPFKLIRNHNELSTKCWVEHKFLNVV